VPGLKAKPINDMLMLLDATNDIERFSRAMEALGYRVRGECLDAEIPGTPGALFLQQGSWRRAHSQGACVASRTPAGTGLTGVP
jgi:GrpB-like predicted nucleotidyltransferase (UPF0157 family)